MVFHWWLCFSSFKTSQQGRNEIRWRQGQKTNSAPPWSDRRPHGRHLALLWSNLISFKGKFTVLKKVLVTLLGLFVATRSGSAPGQLCPFRYAAPVPNPTRCWILKSKNRLSMQWSSSRPAALSLRWSLFIERSSRDGATRRLQGVFDTQADTE